MKNIIFWVLILIISLCLNCTKILYAKTMQDGISRIAAMNKKLVRVEHQDSLYYFYFR